MNLVIAFDDKLLRQYDERGESAFFTIYWCYDGGFYPSEGWYDFGAIVLDWWIIAARQLLRGATSQDFGFMDGPYWLTVRVESDGSRISCRDLRNSVSWVATLEELVSEIKQAANNVVRHLIERNVNAKDRTCLQLGLSRLQQVLADKHLRERDVNEAGGRNGDIR